MFSQAINSIALNLACSRLRDSRVRNQEGVNKSETVSIVFIATDFLDSGIYNFFLADRLSRLCLALKCSAFAYTKLTTLPYLLLNYTLEVQHRDERLLNRQRTLK